MGDAKKCNVLYNKQLCLLTIRAAKVRKKLLLCGKSKSKSDDTFGINGKTAFTQCKHGIYTVQTRHLHNANTAFAQRKHGICGRPFLWCRTGVYSLLVSVAPATQHALIEFLFGGRVLSVPQTAVLQIVGHELLFDKVVVVVVSILISVGVA